MEPAGVNWSGRGVPMGVNVFSRTIPFSLCLLLIGFSVSLMAAPQGPVIGKVTLLLGSVTIVDQDGDTFEAARGTQLHAGYTLDTSTRSFVRAEMNDGTQLTLTADSSATLEEFQFNEAARTGGFNATVQRGGFKYSSGRLGAFALGKQHSVISTPSGVIGVRGTVIEAVLEGGQLTINVPVGNIDITFTRADGSTFTQTVGVDAPIQIVQVADGAELVGLDEVPEALQVVVQVLEQQVRQAEEASDSDNSSNDGDESSDADADADKEASQQEPQTTTLDLDTNTLTTPSDGDSSSTPSGGGGTVIDIPASPSTIQ